MSYFNAKMHEIPTNFQAVLHFYCVIYYSRDRDFYLPKQVYNTSIIRLLHLAGFQKG